MKKILSRSTLLAVLMAGFVSLFAVGCGSSDNFVATGTNNNPTGQTGNLVFNFVQAQSADVVPVGTTTLRFDFFSSTTPSQSTFLFTETRAFANQIIIEDVPVTVQAVVVTAFGANGEPLAVLTGTPVVVPGTTNNVDLVFNSNPTLNSITLTPSPAIILTPGSPTAQVAVSANFTASAVLGQQTDYNVNLPLDGGVTFSFTEFPQTPAQLRTANITTSGLVTLERVQQNSTLTASYTAFGNTETDSTLVRTCNFSGSFASSFQLPLNNSGSDFYNGGYNAIFEDSDGQVGINVAANSTYALQTPATGITVNPTTGRIDVASTATAGTYNIVVTWVDPRTQNADGTGGTASTFTFTLPFTVVSNP